jgi:hypothetical protein
VWLEKWGLVTAITTIISVALMGIAQLVVISKWTGAQEIKTQVACDRVTVIEQHVSSFPNQYYTKNEAQIRWDQHMRKESEERSELIAKFNSIDGKLDGLYNLLLVGKKRNGSL